MSQRTPNNNNPEQAVALVQKLFLSNSALIRGYLLTMLPDVNQVDDVLQSTYMAAVRKAGDFQEGSNFVGWARAIARFELLRLRRDQQRAPRPLHEDVIDKLSEEVPQFDISDERISAVASCMQELSSRAKQSIMLRYMHALSPAEVAKRMSLTLGAAKVTLTRARIAIRECVERKLQAAENL